MNQPKSLADQPIILIYTMTAGLGDYLVLGDLLHKAKLLLPQAECLLIHRANSHVSHWPYGNYRNVFFNVYSLTEMLRLAGILLNYRRRGYVVFGLQMAPGSLQGFLLHRCLKSIRGLDYIVDSNLINADLVVPARGNYILERHLNQLADLLNVGIPSNYYRLNLPLSDFKGHSIVRPTGRRLVGIHPWSRRDSYSFFWSLDNWIKVIENLLRHEDVDCVFFGKDVKFQEFADCLRRKFVGAQKRFHFVPSQSIEHLSRTIADVDVVLSVNTAIVHIAYALNKKMVILSGPSLDEWNPRGDHIRIVRDRQALLTGADRPNPDERLPQVTRIKVQDVLDAFESL